jgi:AraC-like DNA-binding protein
MTDEGGAWLGTAGPGRTVHRHPALEFNLVVRGTARYLLGDRRYDLGPDSLVWLFPEQDHLLVDNSPDFQAWFAFVHPPPLRRAFSHQPAGQSPATYKTLMSGDPAGHFCRQLPAATARRLAALLTEVGKSHGDTPRLGAGLAFLAMTAWAMHLTAPPVPEGARLHPAVEHTAFRLSNDGESELEAVAAKSGLSASRLRHLFRAQTGQSLVAFRNQQRIRRLIEDVENGDRRPLLAIALDAGFGSYAQFHRVFRSCIGVGPRTWMAGRSS